MADGSGDRVVRSIRKGRRKFKRRVAQRISALVIGLAVFVLVAFGIVTYSPVGEPIDHWWSFAALVLLGASWIVGETIIRETRSLLADLRTDFHNHVNEVGKQIEARLEPSIYIMKDKREVQEKLADELKKYVNNRKLLDTPGPSIEIFGSVDLMPSDSQIREAEANDEAIAHSIRYRDTLNEVLERGEVKVDRYIRFFQPENLKSRSENQRSEYLTWLEKQKAIIASTPSYSLWNSRRAPRWKSQRTTYIFQYAYIDVFPNADGGTIIRGEDVTMKLRRASSKFLWDSAKENQPRQYGRNNLDDFEKYIRAIRQVVDATDES